MTLATNHRPRVDFLFHGFFFTSCRAENKTSGLAGQTEILIGHLYTFMIKFWVAIVENCTENSYGPYNTKSDEVRFMNEIHKHDKHSFW